MSVESALLDPAWFPDRIDPENRLIRLVKTTPAILRESAFLDGRTPLSGGLEAPIVMDLDQFVAGVTGTVPAMRWIFHASFCGSTLLARFATIEARSLCLREPQVLVDLANWRTALTMRDQTIYQATLAAVLKKLSQRWRPEEIISIKPSNWINGIISDLWDRSRGDHVLITDIETEPFLVANLRGGRERIAYTLRLCNQISVAWPMIGEAMNTVMPEGDSPITKALRLVAGTLWAQKLLFHARCLVTGRDFDAIRLVFPGFLEDRHSIATMLNHRLALHGLTEALGVSIERNLSRHSKQADLTIPIHGEEAANLQIRAEYAPALAAGCETRDKLHAAGPAILPALVAAMHALDGGRGTDCGSTQAEIGC